MKSRHALVEPALVFLALFLPGYLSQAGFSGPGVLSTFALLQSIVIGVPQILLMAYIAGASGPVSAPRLGLSPLEARDAARIVLVLAACVAVVAPFFALVAVLPPGWSRALSMGYRWGLGGAGQLPLALLFGLTAGYREELVFRAYLLERLEEAAVPRGWAVAASTALFSVGHVYEGPLGVAIAALLGLVLALAYLARRNLHVIAIAHGLYNTSALALSLLAPHALPSALLGRIFSF